MTLQSDSDQIALRSKLVIKQKMKKMTDPVKINEEAPKRQIQYLKIEIETVENQKTISCRCLISHTIHSS